MKRRDFLATSLGTALVARQAFAQVAPCAPPTVTAVGGSQSQTSCGSGGGGGGGAPSGDVAANTAMLVGTNTENSVRPTNYSTSEVQYSLFASFSGGVLVPGWGTHGCYACVGTGGHNANENTGAFIFDFADYTWKYLPNANGVGPRPNPYTFSETSQSPWWEINGGTQLPAPGHTYRHQAAVGSTIYRPVNAFCAVNPADGQAGGSTMMHKVTLNSNNTCTWARAANNSTYTAFTGFSSFGGIDYAETFYDAGRKRLWFMSDMTHWIATIPFFDLNGTSWSGLPVVALTPQVTGAGFLIYDDAQDCLFAAGSNNQLYRLNLAGLLLQGWTAVSSTNLASIGMAGSVFTRWHRYPTADGGDGCFYTYFDDGQNRLKRFDPSSRTFSYVTIANGPALPRQNPSSGKILDLSMVHYTRFFYVPARKAFAWIAGNGQKVALLRP